MVIDVAAISPVLTALLKITSPVSKRKDQCLNSPDSTEFSVSRKKVAYTEKMSQLLNLGSWLVLKLQIDKIAHHY